jgi:hypothetical protein
MRLSPDFLKRKILLILSVIFIVNNGYGQGYKSDIKPIGLKKNVIYATLGVDPGEFYGTLLGNYERMVIQFQNPFVNSLWVRVGAGPWVWWTGKGTNYVATISALTGRKGSHLETGAGVLFTYDSDRRSFHPLINDRHLAGNIGFRFQKPEGLFVLRTGIGWPEFIYLSLGFCF